MVLACRPNKHPRRILKAGAGRIGEQQGDPGIAQRVIGLLWIAESGGEVGSGVHPDGEDPEQDDDGRDELDTLPGPEAG